MIPTALPYVLAVLAIAAVPISLFLSHRRDGAATAQMLAAFQETLQMQLQLRSKQEASNAKQDEKRVKMLADILQQHRLSEEERATREALAAEKRAELESEKQKLDTDLEKIRLGNEARELELKERMTALEEKRQKLVFEREDLKNEGIRQRANLQGQQLAGAGQPKAPGYGPVPR